jgi:hypothetical protein
MNAIIVASMAHGQQLISIWRNGESVIFNGGVNINNNESNQQYRNIIIMA